MEHKGECATVLSYSLDFLGILDYLIEFIMMDVRTCTLGDVVTIFIGIIIT